MRRAARLGYVIASVVLTSSAAQAARPRLACIPATANGTGVSEKIAKFQVYEGLIKSAGTDVWLQWMANGATPGYTIKRLKYACVTGTGLGVTCRGKAAICRK